MQSTDSYAMIQYTDYGVIFFKLRQKGYRNKLGIIHSSVCASLMKRLELETGFKIPGYHSKSDLELWCQR